jgi:integrase
MPLKLIDPRPGKSPNYYIRGTYLGVELNETTGTPVKAVAQALLRKKREDIERGEIQSRRDLKKLPTFLDAALSYINAGGERRFIGEFNDETGEWKPGLITHFGDTLLRDIDQTAVEAAAIALYPTRSSATRNRQVYTPMSAILKHAGIQIQLKRPKGAQGQQRTTWLTPDQANTMLDAAEDIDYEFSIFLTFLLYTGCRLSDALNLTCDRVILAEAFAHFPKTKNDDPRSVHIPPDLFVAMASHPDGLDRGKAKVFRFNKNGHLYNLLKRVKEKSETLPDDMSFHVLSHTWATWMRRYGGLDQRGLVGTGRWKDPKSAARYAHVVVSEESRKADMLPKRERKKNKVHGKSTSRNAVFRLRSPNNAGKRK